MSSQKFDFGNGMVLTVEPDGFIYSVNEKRVVDASKIKKGGCILLDVIVENDAESSDDSGFPAASQN